MRAIPIELPAASGLLINSAGCLVWHSTRETTGSAAAVYRLWDSNTNAGQQLLTVSLSSGESTRDYIQAHHLEFKTSLYFELVSGAVEGMVSVLCDHRCIDAWHWQMEQIAAGGQ